jgi:hypothetical protein
MEIAEYTFGFNPFPNSKTNRNKIVPLNRETKGIVDDEIFEDDNFVDDVDSR